MSASLKLFMVSFHAFGGDPQVFFYRAVCRQPEAVTRLAKSLLPKDEREDICFDFHLEVPLDAATKLESGEVRIFDGGYGCDL